MQSLFTVDISMHISLGKPLLVSSISNYFWMMCQLKYTECLITALPPQTTGNSVIRNRYTTIYCSTWAQPLGGRGVETPPKFGRTPQLFT